MAEDTARLDFGVTGCKLQFHFTKPRAVEQRQVELGENRVRFLLARPQSDLRTAGSCLVQRVRTEFLFLKTIMQTNSKPYRFIVVGQVKQGGVRSNDVHDVHLQILEVVTHDHARETVFFFRIHEFVIGGRPAWIVRRWMGDLGIPDREAVFVHHEVRRAKRVPAGIALRSSLTTQCLDQFRRDFLRLVRFANTFRPDPVGVDDPVIKRQLTTQTNPDVVTLRATQPAVDAVVVHPVKVRVTRVLRECKEQSALVAVAYRARETCILKERDAATGRVEPCRYHRHSVRAKSRRHVHQENACFRVALHVDVCNPVTVKVTVGDTVAVEILRKDKTLAGLGEVIVTTVAVQIEEVELTVYRVEPHRREGALTRVVVLVVERRVPKLGSSWQPVVCVGAIRKCAEWVTGVGANSDRHGVRDKGAVSGVKIVETRRIHACVVVNVAGNDLTAYGQVVVHIVLKVRHTLATLLLCLQILVVGVDRPAVPRGAVGVDCAVQEVGVLAKVVVDIGCAFLMSEGLASNRTVCGCPLFKRTTGTGIDLAVGRSISREGCP